MEILLKFRPQLIEAMDRLLQAPQSPVLEMCRYHLGLANVDANDAAGKMLRGSLCLALSGGLGGDVHRTLPAALSVELVHRTSLVFDDMQDDSGERNHQPTVWKRWGRDQAMNVGLALSCYARLALQGTCSTCHYPHPYRRVQRALETAVIDLCHGQYLDLEFRKSLPSLEEYRRMVRLKTGVLLGAACRVAAIIAGHDDQVIARATMFGELLGIAFQMRDDNLGVWGEAEVMGKLPEDLVERKRGLPLVLAIRSFPDAAAALLTPSGIVHDNGALRHLVDAPGLREEAERLAHTAAEEAVWNLEQLPLEVETRRRLTELADFAVERVA